MGIAGKVAGAVVLIGLVHGVLGGDLSFGGSSDVAAVESRSAAWESRLKPGEVLIVAADHADLMLGDQVLAVLPRGQPILVVESRDAWVGTNVSIKGQRKAGWIRMEDFIPREVSPRTFASSAATAGSGAAVVPGPHAYATAYGSDLRQPAPQPALVPQSVPATAQQDWPSSDPWSIGRYERHETDPNLHTWEPWRSR